MTTNGTDARITIGGTVTMVALLDLQGIAAADRILTDWNGNPFQATDAEGDLEGPLKLFKLGTSDGRIDRVEQWCVRNRTPYRLWAEGSGSDDPFAVVYDGTEPAVTIACNAAGDAVLTIEQASALGPDEMRRLADLMDFEIPPIRIAADGAAPTQPATPSAVPTGYAGGILPWEAIDPHERPRLAEPALRPWPVSLDMNSQQATLRIADPVNDRKSDLCMDHNVIVEINDGAIRVHVRRTGELEVVTLTLTRDGMDVEMPRNVAMRVSEGGTTGIDPRFARTGQKLRQDADPKKRRGPMRCEPNDAQRTLLRRYENVALIGLPTDEGMIDAAVRSGRDIGDDLFRFLWMELADCGNPQETLLAAKRDIENVADGLHDRDDPVTWEVLGYATQGTYDRHKGFDAIDGNLTSHASAMDIGRAALRDYAVVKVQSSDRETIVVLTHEQQTDEG